jgi:hypothetical protein
MSEASALNDFRCFAIHCRRVRRVDVEARDLDRRRAAAQA